MSEKRAWRLGDELHRKLVGSLVATSPAGHFVTVEPPRRTLDQNARLHALLGDLVKGGFDHHGRKLDAEDLKTLFVTAWMIETGKGSDIVPGLNGGVVQLRRSTAKMTKEEIGEVMIIIERTAAERGIALMDDA